MSGTIHPMTRGDILGHRIYAHGNICKQNTFVSIFKSFVFYVIFLIWDVFFLEITACNIIWNAGNFSTFSVLKVSLYSTTFLQPNHKNKSSCNILNDLCCNLWCNVFSVFWIESHFKKLKINRELWKGFIIELKHRIINGANF